MKKQKMKRFGEKKSLGQSFFLWLIMLPGVVYIFVNNILPMYGLTIAFRKISYAKGPLASPFYGFGKLSEYSLFYNFEQLFKLDAVWDALQNTVLYNLLFLVLGLFIPVAVAILFDTIASKRAKKVFQTCILLPNIISWVIISYIGFSLFSQESGLLTHLLGINDFYSNPEYWPYILTFFHMWKGIGMSMVIYVSALVSIDSEMHEAAKIDGAGWWQRTFYITIPQLKKMMITLFILNLAKIMTSDFGLFYQLPMNIGSLYETTRTLDVLVYNTLMGRSANIALSSAVSVFQSAVGFVLIIVSNAIIKRVDRESALF